jgi:hypothetical protein
MDSNILGLRNVLLLALVINFDQFFLFAKCMVEIEVFGSSLHCDKANRHQACSVLNIHQTSTVIITFCWFPIFVLNIIPLSDISDAGLIIANVIPASQGLLSSIAFFYLNPFVIKKYRKLLVD